jgi:hypothetical protein
LPSMHTTGCVLTRGFQKYQNFSFLANFRGKYGLKTFKNGVLRPSLEWIFREGQTAAILLTPILGPWDL